MKCTVIIPAGGMGKRIGSDVPKQFLELKEKPLIVHTIETFEKMEEVDNIVVAVHKDWYKFTEELFLKFKINKVKEIVYSGEKRQDSVYNALQSEISKDSDILLVHDAVRPFVSKEVVHRVIEAADETGAAIPVIDTKDTIKERTPKNYVLKTFNRNNLCAAQTPQGFWYDVLLSAYENAKKNEFTGTDSASLVEFNGYKVTVVEGDEMNLKITTPFDLDVGKLMLDKRD